MHRAQSGFLICRFSVNSLMFIWDASKLIIINNFSLHNLLANKQNLKVDIY